MPQEIRNSDYKLRIVDNLDYNEKIYILENQLSDAAIELLKIRAIDELKEYGIDKTYGFLLDIIKSDPMNKYSWELKFFFMDCTDDIKQCTKNISMRKYMECYNYIQNFKKFIEEDKDWIIVDRYWVQVYLGMKDYRPAYP